MWGLMPTHLFVIAIAGVVIACVGALLARLSIPSIRAVVKADTRREESRREPRDR